MIAYIEGSLPVTWFYVYDDSTYPWFSGFVNNMGGSDNWSVMGALQRQIINNKIELAIILTFRYGSSHDSLYEEYILPYNSSETFWNSHKGVNQD